MRIYLLTGSFAAARVAEPGETPGGGIAEILLHEHRQDDVWGEHARELVGEVARENPGFRPWGWWRWTAPEPRRHLNGTAALIRFDPWWREGFGLPLVQGPDASDPPSFESQPAYLQRIGGLTPAERRALPRDAFDPLQIVPHPDLAGELALVPSEWWQYAIEAAETESAP